MKKLHGRSLWSLLVGFRSTTSCCTARSATGMIGSVGEWARVERRPTTIISSVSEGWIFRLFFSTYVLILPNAATPVWSIDEPINRLVSSAYFGASGASGGDRMQLYQMKVGPQPSPGCLTRRWQPLWR